MIDFGTLSEYLDSLETRFGIPGGDCCIYMEHRPVFRRSIGVSQNALYFLYSASKVITSAAGLRAVEQGLFGLEDELARYLPEFKEMTVMTPDGIKSAEKPIKIIDLFTMCAGLDYNLKADGITAALSRNPNASLREIVRGIAEAPLLFEPSSHFNYSLCLDVLGAVIEVTSGRTLSEYMKRELFAPLEMGSTGFDLNEEVLSRLAEQYCYDPDTGTAAVMEKENIYRLSPGFESGGAGIMSCTEDYMKLIDALANGGTAQNGYRVLKESSVEQMKANRLKGEALAEFGQIKPGYGYGLGVRTLIDPAYSESPVGEFGWDSAGGSYVIIDTQNRLAVFYAQHLKNCAVIHNEVHPHMRDLIYKALKSCNGL